jgi:outer membrane biosynthesis protein TonB
MAERTQRCPTCGAPAPERARFCAECGTRLAPDTAAATENQRPNRLDELGRTAQLRLRHLGTRTRALAQNLGASQSARARVAAARSRQARLLLERDEALHALGAAVYAGDAAGTESARDRVAALDAAIATLEDEMTAALADADARIRANAAELRPTEAYTRPANPEEPDPAAEPAPAEEPWPPPNEADPPQPAIVPEPSPQPVEEPYPPAS